PEGLIAYGIRSDDDDDSIPRTVEPSVCVNSFGTLIINEPLDFGSADHIRITEWGFLDNDDAPQWAQPYLD
ncbi:hypothetical protein LJC45_04955, partial [Alistipes sp. OttesenSCG-928-B03]|nr:hypothetical protein [Alistipes sp. OttesenSCG-928-B03]